VIWLWQGEQLTLPNVSAFTVQLSRICEAVYVLIKSPVFGVVQDQSP